MVHGLQNGRKFGFPTANVQLYKPESFEKGVYACWVEVSNRLFKGMLYIGTRPTLDLTELSLEIHILDFDEDIYDMDISFVVVEKIRSEQKFPNIKELIQQVERDKEAIRNLLD